MTGDCCDRLYYMYAGRGTIRVRVVITYLLRITSSRFYDPLTASLKLQHILERVCGSIKHSRRCRSRCTIIIFCNFDKIIFKLAELSFGLINVCSRVIYLQIDFLQSRNACTTYETWTGTLKKYAHSRTHTHIRSFRRQQIGLCYTCHL